MSFANLHMLTLTRNGAKLSGCAGELERLAEEFASNHFLKLSGMIDPGLYALLQSRVERAAFRPRGHDRIDGSEFSMHDPSAANLLSFLMNGTQLFDFVERVTGCQRIGSFSGRIYRLVPGGRHQLHWHDDCVESRRIALSLNLGVEPYVGGCLQLRAVGMQGILAEIPNTEPNSAILFRVSESLEHRVTAIEGEVGKTAYSGWFSSFPDIRSRLATARGN